MSNLMDIDNVELSDVKKFITDRLSNRKIGLKSLKIELAEAVSFAIEADEEFIEMMIKQECNYSNDDEMAFIKEKTRLDLDFIDLILWQKNCYEMSLGMWEYAMEDCLNCGKGPLHLKEVPGKDYEEKIVCQECGFEMILGEDGLEKYND